MTDNEIKKALVCCINGKCNECPLYAMNCSPKVAMAFSADFITRQKAEIERLEKIRADLSIYVAELKEYIDRCESGEEYWVKCLLERPNEAIKEVAEVLEAELESANKYIREYDDSAEQRAYTKGLHNAWSIVKEMAGERE